MGAPLKHITRPARPRPRPAATVKAARTALLAALLAAVVACTHGGATTTRGSRDGARPEPSTRANAAQSPVPNHATRPPETAAARNTAQVAHVFVALCDNVNQGIVPVPARLGDGDAPATNLYWGAGFGVKTFFKKSKDWRLVAESRNPRAGVLERLVFRHRTRDAYLVADAYRGSEIKACTLDFLDASAGAPGETLDLALDHSRASVHTAGSADLVAYVGHDGLMDFTLPALPQRRDERERDAVILACASKQYFAPALRATGARPLLWTTNLMAPEAYVLDAALTGWLARETGQQVRARAATAYHKYQRCGLRAATNLFATGFESRPRAETT